MRTQVITICKYCSDEFIAYRRGAKWCSRACDNKAKVRRLNKKCPDCSASIIDIATKCRGCASKSHDHYWGDKISTAKKGKPIDATIQSTQILIASPALLQSFVLFDDGQGTTFTKSYTYPVGSDPLDQIQADIEAYNAASVAVDTITTDIQAKLSKTPMDSVSVAEVSLGAATLGG